MSPWLKAHIQCTTWMCRAQAHSTCNRAVSDIQVSNARTDNVIVRLHLQCLPFESSQLQMGTIVCYTCTDAKEFFDVK